MGYMESYKAWCANEYFDEATRAELKSIEGNEKEIEDRFYKDLEFGTGGLRGVIGNGTNRMNIYTVRKATQGLANFIKKENAATEALRLHMIQEECPLNLQTRQHYASMRTESRHISSRH